MFSMIPSIGPRNPISGILDGQWTLLVLERNMYIISISRVLFIHIHLAFTYCVTTTFVLKYNWNVCEDLRFVPLDLGSNVCI